jgi:hypothetical protein
MTPEQLVESREKTHGSFTSKAGFIQNMKHHARQTGGWDGMNVVQQEAFDAIICKLGRILTGNPNEPDHWDDIAGYAVLAKGELS